MGGAVLRAAAAEDAAAIPALTREAYAKWVPVIGREPAPMTAGGSSRLSREQGAFSSRTSRWLPLSWGKGLGRSLMAHAEQVAASSGFAEIRLYINELFAENVRLYRTLGYKVDRGEAFRGGSRVHMRKSIRA